MNILLAGVVLEEDKVMRPDLEGLEITKGERSNLSGVKAENVLKKPTIVGFLFSHVVPNLDESFRGGFIALISIFLLLSIVLLFLGIPVGFIPIFMQFIFILIFCI